MDDFGRFVSEVRAATGLDMLVPDDTGTVTFSVDDRYVVCLQHIEATGKLLCFVEVASLGGIAPVKVYRELLAGALFGRETAGGYFALEPETETVVYNYLFDFDRVAKDAAAFVEELDKLLSLCDMWAERIKEAGVEDGGQKLPPGGMAV